MSETFKSDDITNSTPPPSLNLEIYLGRIGKLVFILHVHIGDRFYILG